MSYLKKTNFFVKITIASFFILVFSLLLKHSFGYLDPDFGWHLKFGEEIALSGDVPRINLVNYTLFNIPWVDHEWLSNLLTYFIFNFSGYVGVNIFFSFLALLAFVVQYLIVKRFFIPKDRLGILIFLVFQFFFIFASLPSLGVRMQEFTLLFTAILLFILYAYEKTSKQAVLIILPPLLYFWASLHGGFLFGLGLLFLFFVAKSIEPFIVRGWSENFLEKRSMSKKSLFIFCFWSLLSFLATLVTPYGLKLYSFLFSYRNDFYLERIFEWFHQFRYPFFYSQLIGLDIAFLILVWWLVRVLLLRRKVETKINLWEAVFFFVLSFMAVRSRRHFPLWSIFSVPILASLTVEFVGLKMKLLPEVIAKSFLLDKGVKIFILFSILISSAACLLASDINNDPWSHYGYKYPYAAVEFLKDHPEYSQGKLFNEFNWGGYLIWVWPGKELFIDGRLPQMEYKGHSLLEEFYEFSSKDKAGDKLNEYSIETVLISAKKDEFSPAWWEKSLLAVKDDDEDKSSLGEYLSSSPDWRLVYNDDVAKVFIRER